jgi:hypothetical protein
MANIRIHDLHYDHTLDAGAMARVRGGDGAAWCFGWIQPFVAERPGLAPVINFYQINNYADQLINQYQLVNVSNTAPNAVVRVGVDERSVNNGQA